MLELSSLLPVLTINPVSGTWLHHLATALGWLALVVVLAGFFVPTIRQWFRRCRRCPKCWYDLAGTGSLRCSECGFTAKRDRQLRKARRRWIVVPIALLILLGRHALLVTPDVRQRGWIAAIPDTALILSFPFLRPNLDFIANELQSASRRKPASYRPRVPEKAYLELLEVRVKERRLESWQEDLLQWICRVSNPLDDPERLWWEFQPEIDVLRLEIIAHTKWAGRAQLTTMMFPDDQETALTASGILSSRRRSASDLSVDYAFFATQPVWPRGAPIFVRFEGPAYGRVIAEPLDAGMRAVDWIDRQRRGSFATSPAGPRFGKWDELAAPNLWTDGNTRLGCLPAPARQPSYRVSLLTPAVTVEIFTAYWHRHETREVKLPIWVSDDATVENLLYRAEREEFDVKLSTLTPTVGPPEVRSGEPPEGMLALDLNADFRQLNEILFPLRGATFAFVAEIYDGDRLIARGEAWMKRTRANVIEPSTAPIELEVLDPSAFEPSQDKQSLRLIIRGDPYIALRDFHCDTWWDGEVELPVTVKP